MDTRATRARHWLACGLTAVLLCACGDRTASGDGNTAATRTVAAAASATIATPAPAASPASAASAANASSAAVPAQAANVDAAAPLVAIEGEGLRLFNADTGASRALPFGSDEAMVLGILQRAFPGELRDPPQRDECGGTVAIAHKGGLAVDFRDGRFIGWSLSDGSKLTNAAGIGLGSTRSDLERVQVPEVRETSLGTEFSVGGMAGLLASQARDARITHLWAGETCIAR